MNKLSILAVALLLLATISTQEYNGTGKQVHFSMHFTLEHSLSLDTSELNTPQCETEEIIDGTINALSEWVDVLSNPADIQGDIDILGQVRLLIVQAKDSIEKVENGFEDSTDQAAEQTSFLQLNSSSKVTLQTEVIHKVFADEMNFILSQLELLNGQDGEPSELVQLAQSILDAIDALVQELNDLQNNEAEFPGYIETLQAKVTEATAIKGECHGTTVVEQQVQQPDNKVSSATLDDFVFTPVTEVANDNSSTESVQNSPQDASTSTDTQQFIANSGQLSFAQKSQKNLRLQRQNTKKVQRN